MQGGQHFSSSVLSRCIYDLLLPFGGLLASAELRQRLRDELRMTRVRFGCKHDPRQLERSFAIPNLCLRTGGQQSRQGKGDLAAVGDPPVAGVEDRLRTYELAEPHQSACSTGHRTNVCRVEFRRSLEVLERGPVITGRHQRSSQQQMRLGVVGSALQNGFEVRDGFCRPLKLDKAAPKIETGGRLIRIYDKGLLIFLYRGVQVAELAQCRAEVDQRACAARVRRHRRRELVGRFPIPTAGEGQPTAHQVDPLTLSQELQLIDHWVWRSHANGSPLLEVSTRGFQITEASVGHRQAVMESVRIRRRLQSRLKVHDGVTELPPVECQLAQTRHRGRRTGVQGKC